MVVVGAAGRPELVEPTAEAWMGSILVFTARTSILIFNFFCREGYFPCVQNERTIVNRRPGRGNGRRLHRNGEAAGRVVRGTGKGSIGRTFGACGGRDGRVGAVCTCGGGVRGAAVEQPRRKRRALSMNFRTRSSSVVWTRGAVVVTGGERAGSDPCGSF
jgi:hypothetical protein